MSRSYYDQKAETAALAETLMARGGWEVAGYKGDKSDMMTDYFDPAYWRGAATHVATGCKLVTRFGGDKNVPQGKSWALLDPSGKRITCGANVSRRGSSEAAMKVARHVLAEKIETAAGAAVVTSVARLARLATAGEDLLSAAAHLEGYGELTEWARRNYTAEQLAEHARHAALAGRFAKARPCHGETEYARKQLSGRLVRDAARRIFEAVGRRIAAACGGNRSLAAV